MALIKVESRWDWPTKKGYYWIISVFNKELRIVEFSNGDFWDVSSFEALGNQINVLKTKVIGVEHYAYISKPKIPNP
ncbi:MAG: hypothetical protein H7Z76_16080 [Methylotenera sp.]|nr:hypothetical protein [Flavobacterium sp.]